MQTAKYYYHPIYSIPLHLLLNISFTKCLGLGRLCQCSKIYSRLFDIIGCIYNFVSLVVAPLKCFVTTLLFLSDNSNPFRYWTKESAKIMVPRSFFLHFLFVRSMFVIFLDYVFFALTVPAVATILCFLVIPLIHVDLHCHFDCPHWQK